MLRPLVGSSGLGLAYMTPPPQVARSWVVSCPLLARGPARLAWTGAVRRRTRSLRCRRLGVVAGRNLRSGGTERTRATDHVKRLSTAHRSENKMDQRYDRAEVLEQRRALMELSGCHVTGRPFPPGIEGRVLPANEPWSAGQVRVSDLAWRGCQETQSCSRFSPCFFPRADEKTGETLGLVGKTRPDVGLGGPSQNQWVTSDSARSRIVRDRKLVEAAGIEPASAGALPSALHA